MLRTAVPLSTLVACLSVLVLTLSGCGYIVARQLEGTEVAPLDDYTFVGDKYPCYLELQKNTEALRVNCFHINGILHIHSSRWSNLPRFSGDSWTIAILQQPRIRVEIDDKIYLLIATWIDDENQRREILHNRGYLHAWSGIKVFRFTAEEGDA